MGKIAAKLLASGDGWQAADVVCTAGPRDRAFEEEHGAWSIAVVLEGSFHYQAACGAAVMAPGSLLLGNCGQCYVCRHEHGTGDRCLSFHYMPEFFDNCGASAFSIPRIPPLPELAPWLAMSFIGVQTPEHVNFEELASGLVEAVMSVAGAHHRRDEKRQAAGERRISAALRFIETHFRESLALRDLAYISKMSEFHFLRTFRQVTGVTPHQYILRTRLREAATRLVTCSDSTLEIALASGFSDLSNFNHAFRAEFGLSPRLYRTSFAVRTRALASAGTLLR